MAKELLLYGDINQYSAADLVRQMDESKDDDIVLRINSHGGVVTDGWSVIAKYSELPNSKSVKVDGVAASMALMFLAYASDSESLDVSNFTLHRAAYPDWYEKSEYFTPEQKANLISMNDNLKKALEAKIDVKKLEELKGVKMKDIFSMDSRIDVNLNAKEAKAIGLINRIVKITPQRKAELNSMFMQAAAHSVPLIEAEITEPTKVELNNKPMNIEKLKAEHPQVYADVLALGVKAEKDRVGAWMAFAEIDPKAVAEGVKSGEAMTQTVMAELTVKSISAKQVAQVTAENPTPTETDPKNAANGAPEKNSAEAKKAAELEAFKKEAYAHLELKAQ
jgi:ATP-dependent Clp protease protease subunit